MGDKAREEEQHDVIEESPDDSGAGQDDPVLEDEDEMDPETFFGPSVPAPDQDDGEEEAEPSTEPSAEEEPIAGPTETTLQPPPLPPPEQTEVLGTFEGRTISAAHVRSLCEATGLTPDQVRAMITRAEQTAHYQGKYHELLEAKDRAARRAGAARAPQPPPQPRTVEQIADDATVLSTSMIENYSPLADRMVARYGDDHPLGPHADPASHALLKHDLALYEQNMVTRHSVANLQRIVNEMINAAQRSSVVHRRMEAAQQLNQIVDGLGEMVPGLGDEEIREAFIASLAEDPDLHNPELWPVEEVGTERFQREIIRRARDFLFAQAPRGAPPSGGQSGNRERARATGPRGGGAAPKPSSGGFKEVDDLFS